MNRFLMLVSLLIASASCNKELTEQVEPNNDTQKVSLTASLTDAETRVAVDTDSDDSWSFTWESNDAISAWYIGCSSVDEFTTKSHDAQSSTFEGTVISGKQYRFVYPYEASAITAEGYYTIDISSQNDEKELDKSYLINDVLVDSDDISEGIVTNLAMKHLGAFMVVDLYLENFNKEYTYTLKKVVYSSSDNIIPVSAEIDMTKGIDDLYVNTTAGEITAQMSEPFTTVSETNYQQAITRLNILPFTVEKGESATIALTIEVSDDNEYIESLTSDITLTNNSEGAIPFARATHNFTYLTVDGSYGAKITGATINGWGFEVDNGELGFAEEWICTASEIDADNMPAIDTWIITDAGEMTAELMTGVRAALEIAKEAGRSIKIVLPNATSIGDYAFSFSLYYPDYSALTYLDAPNITSIGYHAFSSCGLTSFDFEGVVEIDVSAFMQCANLTEVTNFSIESISDWTFSYTGLTSFDFEGVVEIGEYAFYSSANLTAIELPATVTSIGEAAFYGELASLSLNWIGDEILAYDSNDFWFELSILDTINIPAGTTDDYVAKGWDRSLLVEKD